MKIIPIAFTTRDLSDFESVLSLAASRLNSRWALAGPGEAGDFHIVALGRPDELPALLRGSSALYPWRVIVYASGESDVGARWTLGRKEGSPPRLSELISLLNSIEQHFIGGESSETAALPAVEADLPIPHEHPAEPDCPEEALAFVPLDNPLAGAGGLDAGAADNQPAPHAMAFAQVRQQDWAKFSAYPAGLSAKESFLELLQRDLNQQATRLYSINDEHMILVSPGEGLFYYRTDVESDLLAYRGSLERIKTKTPLLDRLPRYTRRFAFTSAPLAELLWLAALIDSQASPLPQSFPETPVRLSTMESLQALPYFAEFSDLAALWHAECLSLEQASLKSGEPMGKTVAFFNAAYLLKLLAADLQAGKAAGDAGTGAAKESAPTSLLQKLGRALWGRKV